VRWVFTDLSEPRSFIFLAYNTPIFLPHDWFWHASSATCQIFNIKIQTKCKGSTYAQADPCSASGTSHHYKKLYKCMALDSCMNVLLVVWSGKFHVITYDICYDSRFKNGPVEDNEKWEVCRWRAMHSCCYTRPIQPPALLVLQLRK
jgi:hypothetical protein